MNTYVTTRISPNGKPLAVQILTGGGTQDIWIYEFARNTLPRFTFSEGAIPLWTPDGRRIIYRRRTPSFCFLSRLADGGGGEEKLLGNDFDDASAAPFSVSPDGKMLLFGRHSPTGMPQTDVLYLDGSGKTRPSLQSAFRKMDGLNRGRGLRALGPQRAGDLLPRPGQMMSGPVETQPSFKAGTPQMLFRGGGYLGVGGYLTTGNYDVAADGLHFLMIKEKEAPGSSKELSIVVHWTDELKAPRPTGKEITPIHYIWCRA